MTPFNSKSIEGIFEGLSDRQKKVIFERFGLDPKSKGRRATLESIGRDLGITRERVRQIEASSLKSIAENTKKHTAVQSLIRDAKKELRDAGGAMRKEELLTTLRKEYEGVHENHLALILAATGAFEAHSGDDSYHPFYYLDKEALKKAESFIGAWVKELRAGKKTVLEGVYADKLRDFIRDKKIGQKEAEHYLSTTKLIHINSFGDVGLTEWSEVNPKTIRDRIHLVLRKKKQPVHFTDIAKLINEAKLDDRVALASTVHNELIKDPRFVLVGRGLYGLAEHGYEPGTAQEVIARILKTQGPMRSTDIVLAVQKERLFKHNTILVNLQNKSLFERLEDGKYKVREA